MGHRHRPRLGPLALAALGLAWHAAAAPTAATLCAIDDVPAATLLVPYFEVDFTSTSHPTTLVTVRNTDAQAVLAQVTLWTDWGIPTLVFHIYLTGYDVQSLNLRDVFNGLLPRTADHGADPLDTPSPGNGISNQGPLSGDSDFPGTVGPCATPYPPFPQPAIDAGTLDRLRRAHLGTPLPGSGLCEGENYGDGVARGYITIDAVVRCALMPPTDPAYFVDIASRRNVLAGRVLYVDPRNDFAQGETAVHLEACPPTGGTSPCPFQPGQLTFYGGLLGGSAADQREPLPSLFSADYFNGGAFDSGTDLLVWRDVKERRSAAACTVPAAGKPLEEIEVVAFDEQENLAEVCYPSDHGVPLGGPSICFPLAVQKVSLQGGNPIGDDPAPPFTFGWMFLSLSHTLTSPDPFPNRAQAWVLVGSSAEGRYSTLHRATALDSGCAASTSGQARVP